jgi:hypothetical protein
MSGYVRFHESKEESCDDKAIIGMHKGSAGRYNTPKGHANRLKVSDYLLYTIGCTMGLYIPDRCLAELGSKACWMESGEQYSQRKAQISPYYTGLQLGPSRSQCLEFLH